MKIINFERYVQETLRTEVRSRHGLSSFVGFVMVMLIIAVFSFVLICNNTGRVLSVIEREKARFILFFGFTTVISGYFYSLRNKFVFGFKDSYLICEALLMPYPRENIKTYKIIETFSNRMVTLVVFFVDKKTPPEMKRKWLSPYDADKGTVTFSMHGFVTGKNDSLTEDRFIKNCAQTAQGCGNCETVW